MDEDAGPERCSDFAITDAEEVRCRMKSSVAMVIAKEAAAEQAWISGSSDRMRFMRARGREVVPVIAAVGGMAVELYGIV